MTNPDPSPEQQAALARAEFNRLETKLAQAAKAPEALLPSSLLKSSPGLAGALGPELTDALAVTTAEVKDWKTKIENLRGEIGKAEGAQNTRRAERDKVFQQVTSLKVKSAEFEAAVTDAQTAQARQLAQERLVNFQWEVRVESLRLQVIEAQLALEVKLADVRELSCTSVRPALQLAERTLERCGRGIARRPRTGARLEPQPRPTRKRRPRWSRRPAGTVPCPPQGRAAGPGGAGPQERAEPATSPSPSYEEQRTLADRAEIDFARIKELLDDGRVSRLDAIRLNNEFRRIGPERDRLLRNEMAMVEAQLQFYEDALTNVEIELLQDSLHDRFEHDLLARTGLAVAMGRGRGLLNELEKEHRELLVRRRSRSRSSRNAHRTRCSRSCAGLASSTRSTGSSAPTSSGSATRSRSGWGPSRRGRASSTTWSRACCGWPRRRSSPTCGASPRPSFVVTALAVLALPLGLMRLRRGIWRLLERDLPASTALDRYTVRKNRERETLTHCVRRSPSRAGRSCEPCESWRLKLARAAIWPLYLVLLAYAARVGSLAAQPGHPGLGDPDRRGDGDPGP